MRIVIASIQTPFIHGGANIHIENLNSALLRYGHDTEIVSLPFKYSDDHYMERMMEYCAELDFNTFHGYRVDKMIALQFPAYYIQHDNKSLWIMHQYRAIYDLYDPMVADDSLKHLKAKIEKMDREIIGLQKPLYANSYTVSKRLKQYNNLNAVPLYHPPANEEKYYCSNDYGYIFYPSRLEKLKRQDLLIKAMQYTHSNAVVIIAGEGSQKQVYQKLIEKLGVAEKIRMVGHISDEEKIAYYARSLAVFFAPYDEDYGYVTLEAMLSSKPVITCRDSGGPLEFIVHNENGFIVDPEPEQIAQVIDRLYESRQFAAQLGLNALQSYRNMNISWDNVVHNLIGS